MKVDAQELLPPEDQDDLSLKVTEETVRKARPWLPLLYTVTGFAAAMVGGLTEHYLLGLRVGIEAPNPTFSALLMLVWALGALAAGKAAPRVPNALYLHAWLSFGLSLGLMLPPLVYAKLTIGTLDTLPGAAWLQLVLGSFPAAFLLGALLPCLIHLAGPKTPHSWTGPLMWTSLGTGTGYWWLHKSLIPSLGSDNTAYATSFVMVSLGLLTMLLSKQGLKPAAIATTSDAASSTPTVKRHRGLIIVTAGGVALGLSHVAWQRLFDVVLEGGIFLSAAGTAAVWLGLAVGALSLTLRPLAKTPLSTVIIFGAWGILFFANSLFIDRAAYAFSQYTRMLVDSVAAFEWVQLGFWGLMLAFIFPTTLLAAALWDLATRAAAGTPNQPPIGQALALASTGWVLAYLASWYVWLPLLGIKGLFQAGGALVGLLAIAFAAELPNWSKMRLAIVSTVPIGVFFLLRAISPFLDLPAVGIARAMPAPDSWGAIRKQTGGLARPTVAADDIQGNVSLYATTSGLDMVTDGRGTSPGEHAPGSRLAAHVPLLLQAEPNNMALLGVGDGVMAAAALTHPIRQLDIYEPSQAAWAAAEALKSVNQNALSDPRVKRRDARQLPPATTRYQVILFPASSVQPQARRREPSYETYQRWLRQLAPDGIFAQEINLEGQNLDTLRTLFATLGEELREMTLWQTQTTRVLLLGQRKPLKVQPSQLQRRLQQIEVRKDLESIGLSRPESLLMLQMGTNHSLSNWALGGHPSFHKRPTLPYLLPGLHYVGAVVLTPYEQDARLLPGGSGDHEHTLRQFLGRNDTVISAEAFAQYAAYQRAQLPLNDTRGLSGRVLREWVEAHPIDVRATLADTQALAEKGHISGALERLQTLSGPTLPHEAKLLKAKLLTTQVLAKHSFLSASPPGLGQAIAAWSDLEKDPQSDRAEVWQRLMLLYQVAGDSRRAYQAAQRALEMLEGRAEIDTLERKVIILLTVGRTALKRGEFDRAEAYAMRALRLDPANISARELRLRIQTSKPQAP